MRAAIESPGTNKNYTLYVLQPGDLRIDDWKSEVGGDEPVVAVFDRSYGTHRIPFSKGDENVLGYFIANVPFSELEDLPRNRAGHYLVANEIHAWELDEPAMDAALEKVQEWALDLGLGAPEMN